jgi:hypothetical protein
MRATCIALIAASAVLLGAQQQQPIRVGTNFVRVDVYPTKDGRIVDGLQAADFDVLEDGVLQNQDGVTSVRAEQVVGLRGDTVEFDAHDFY